MRHMLRRSSSTGFSCSGKKGRLSGCHVVSPSQVLPRSNEASETGSQARRSAAVKNSRDLEKGTCVSDPVAGSISVTGGRRGGRSSSRRSWCATAAQPPHAVDASS